MMSKSGRPQQRVEAGAILFQHGGGPVQPRLVAIGLEADLDRRAADRPGAERGAQGVDAGALAEREAEPHPGQTIGLAERAQHQRAGQRQQGRQAGFARQHVDEGFVHDQAFAARAHVAGEGAEFARIAQPAVRIVRIDDHGGVGAGEILEIFADRDLGAAGGPDAFVFAIGEAEDGDCFRAERARQQLDQRLRPRRGDDARARAETENSAPPPPPAPRRIPPRAAAHKPPR